MAAKITISGEAALARALRDLGGKVAGRLGSNAVRAGARVIASDAKRRAPRDRPLYFRTIRIFTDPADRRSGGGSRTAYAGSRSPVGWLLEFGTRHSAAQPHLRPALDQAGSKARDKMISNLVRGIERETAKHRGR